MRGSPKPNRINPMGGEEEDGNVEANPAVGWRAWMEDEYRRIREHAETYPYVWASYIVVYGGLGAWAAYRWRKLRRTEDRVRALQLRLRQLVEAEEAAAKSNGPPPSTSAAVGSNGAASSTSAPLLPPTAEDKSRGQ